MTSISYSVTATHPDESSLRRYLQWLADGHVQAVIAGGAESAEIVELDADTSRTHRAESRYVFPSREAFARYESEYAPALRADGLRLFGPESGVTFERRVGEIRGEWTANS